MMDDYEIDIGNPEYFKYFNKRYARAHQAFLEGNYSNSLWAYMRKAVQEKRNILKETDDCQDGDLKDYLFGRAAYEFISPLSGQQLIDDIKWFSGAGDNISKKVFEQLLTEDGNLEKIADECIRHFNENILDFVMPIERAATKQQIKAEEENKKIDFLLKERDYTPPSTDFIALTLNALLMKDMPHFVEALQKVKYPVAIRSILSWSNLAYKRKNLIALMKCAKKCTNEDDEWNGEMLAPLVLDRIWDYIKEIMWKNKKIETHLFSYKDIEKEYSYLSSVLLPFFEAVAERTDALFLIKKWSCVVLSPHLKFGHSQEFKSALMSIIGEAIKRCGKMLTFEEGYPIREQLLLLIWGGVGVDYLDYFYRIYDSPENIHTYSGELKNEHFAFARMFLISENPAEIWKNKWVELSDFRLRYARNSLGEYNNLILINSSLYHVLIGEAIMFYLLDDPKNKEKTRHFLEVLWSALRELYSLHCSRNEFFTDLRIKTILLLMESFDEDLFLSCLSEVENNYRLIADLLRSFKLKGKNMDFFMKHSAVFSNVLIYKEIYEMRDKRRNIPYLLEDCEEVLSIFNQK